MARKHPAAAPTAGNSVPNWVWHFDRVDWWDDTEQPPQTELEHWHNSAGMNHGVTVEGCLGTWRWCQARRRWRKASEDWCAERGYSYAMTVLGWHRPCPSEEATGHTGSPWPKGRPPPSTATAGG